MNPISWFFVGLAYVAGAVFALGFGWKLWSWLRAPNPLIIPTTPAPTTAVGAAARVAGEALFFKSLFRGNRWTWFFGYLMHLSIAVALMRHAVVPLGVPVGGSDLDFTALGPALNDLIRPIWDATFRLGPLFPIAVIGLLARRAWVERTRYISYAADYAILLLLLGIGGSGVLMKYVWEPDVDAVHHFVFGLNPGHPFAQAPLGDPLFLVHFSLVMTLMMVFPFSKLLHAGGIFFSPTRNQPDNPREVRHVTPWAGQ